MNCLVEVGHIHLDEVVNSSHLTAINIYKENYYGCNSVLLLDDLNIEVVKTSASDFVKFYEKEGVILNHVNFESNMVQKAQLIYPLLKKNIIIERFGKSFKNVHFIKIDNLKVPLFSVKDNGEKKYTCYYLSLCWALYKLNYWNDFIDYDSQIVVIDKTFKKIEESVEVILKTIFNYDKKIKNVYF
jgi:hypothetical protein